MKTQAIALYFVVPLTDFLKYMVIASFREWAFFLFLFNSPGNLKLNLEVVERECIVKTFRPF